jgi:two-component system sensor histidine kinase LytS
MIDSLRSIAVDIFKLLSTILILVFFVGKIPLFQQLFFRKPSNLATLFLAAFFGICGIAGTYGFPVENATANTRAVAVIVGGLVAGPLVGLGAGLVAGLHRLLLGGLTAEAAFVSVVLQGYLAGKYFEKIKRRATWKEALGIGAILEIIHFLIVLAISRPLDEAWSVVQIIAPPMILVNSVGVFFFLIVLDSVIPKQAVPAPTTLLPTLPKSDRGKNVIPIRLEEKTVLVQQNHITFIKATGQKKTTVHTIKGIYETHCTLKEIEEILNPDKFFRTHKSYIVNLERVTEIVPWFSSTCLLVLDGSNEKDIPVSRYFMKEFNARLGIINK